jgi:hypothetical protein
MVVIIAEKVNSRAEYKAEADLSSIVLRMVLLYFFQKKESYLISSL